MNDQLTAIGEALERAAAADLRNAHRQPRSRRTSRVVGAVAAAVIAVPAVAYAASTLLTNGQVAASLPQGTKALIGTDPTCTAVVVGVEYHCVLAFAPSNAGAPQSAGNSHGTTRLHTTAIPFDRQVVVKVTKSDGSTEILSAASLMALKQELRALGRVTQITVLTANGRHVQIKPAQLRSASNNGVYTTPVGPAQGTATTNGGVYTGPTVTQSPGVQATDWTGTVEPTVDASKHVNGGCRAQNAAGTEWECYIGEAAVKQNIIGQGFLGAYAPAPGVG